MTGIRVERHDDIWTILLDRVDKRNALSAAMVEGLQDAVSDAHARHARMLVIRGEGRNLSAGFDFTGFEGESEGDLLLRFVRIEQLLQQIERSPCLTLGLAHGRNFGAGVDLFAVCRHRIAAPDASFRMPGLKFGLVLGTRRLARMVGACAALSVLEDASAFDAGWALQSGFVEHLAEPDAWPALIESFGDRARTLDDWSREALYDAVSSRQGERDLAALVQSAARPGLKSRIARYLQDTGASVSRKVAD